MSGRGHGGGSYRVNTGIRRDGEALIGIEIVFVPSQVAPSWNATGGHTKLPIVAAGVGEIPVGHLDQAARGVVELDAVEGGQVRIGEDFV